MQRLLIIAALFFVLTAVGCDDKKKDTFSGLSDMVAQRNDARKTIAEGNAQKKKKTAGARVQDDDDPGTRQDRSSGDRLLVDVVYDKDIVIVDSQTGMTLAKGVAYMNKKGQVVKIKILRD